MTTRRKIALAGLLGGLGAPQCGRGQGGAALRRVGVLQVPSEAASAQRHEAFRLGMLELGWVAGKNIAYRFAYADGDVSRLEALASELIDHKAEVIVNSSGASTRALQRATKTIPIVMVNVSDPVGNGFVASLARPGGNITGLSNQQEDVLGKLIELLHELAPSARRLAIVLNENNPSQAVLWAAAQAACMALGLQPIRVAANAPDQLAAAVAQIVNQRAQAVVFIADPMYTSQRDHIAALMLPTRLPVGYGLRDHVLAGGLLSYGVNFDSSWRYAAKYVDKILKGARPTDLPVEQPTRFEFVINLKTAKALGLTIPQELRLRADEVIQ